MILLRATYNTDGKGLPMYTLNQIAHADETDELIEAMNTDVSETMVNDLLDDLNGDPDQDKDAERLRNDPDLEQKWANDKRFEISRGLFSARTLVYNYDDGSRGSVTYFFVIGSISTITSTAPDHLL